MITKTANAVVGAFNGALNTLQVTPQDQKILADATDVGNSKMNLVLRNVARGAIGGAIGGKVGSLMAKRFKLDKMAPVLTISGGMMGSGLLTSKYSRASAAALRLANLEKELKDKK